MVDEAEGSSTATRERSSKRKFLDEPPKLMSDASSVQSSSALENPWLRAYQPPPVVNQSTVLIIGFLIFALATLWPPLILLVAYLVSKLIPYSFRVNDDATTRRQLFQEFANDEDGTPERFKSVPEHIVLERAYWVNQRGMCLNTITMTPRKEPIEAVVCFCHGYGDSVSFMKRVENERFIEHGIAWVAIEYEGHGQSDGTLGLINDWETMVDDVTDFFEEVSVTKFEGKPIFLMGESMGGAVAYSVYNRIPEIFRGVLFVCPMCKISDHMLPPQWVIDFLAWLIGPTGTNTFLGVLPIAPSDSDKLVNVTCRVPEKRDILSRTPTSYGRNPRLTTARELIDVTQRISSSLKQFDAPFLVVHGSDDLVTDPELSKALYAESRSKDKSIRLYDKMWHSLLCGEPDKNIDRVFNDCIEWILERV